MIGIRTETLNLVDQVKAGSSTAALATINTHTGLLEVANLGDSWVAVIRNGAYVLETEEQQHYFNCPYQLAVVRDSDSNNYVDHPDMADCHALQAQDGDIIILATDGYSDNVFSDDTLAMVTRLNLDEVGSVDVLAAQMVKSAWDRANSSKAYTPFAEKARAEGSDFRGGKIDDITIIVARVSSKGPGCEDGTPSSGSQPNGPIAKSRL
jgi:protein phosphatase PTC7